MRARRAAVAVVASVMALAARDLGAGPERDQPGVTAIRAGRVLTGTGVLERVVVLIEQGRIAAVGPEVAIPEGATILDVPGGTVMPGIIDAGSTLGLHERDENEQSDEVTPEFRVLDGCDLRHPHFRRAVASGVTSVFVTPGTANVWCGLAAVIKTAGENDAGRVVRDPAGLKITLGSDPSRGNTAPRGGPPLTFFFRRPTTRMGVVWILRKGFFDARRTAEGLTGDGAEAPPGGRDVKKEVILEALEGRLPLFAHARKEQDIRAAFRIADEFGVRVTVEEGTEAWKLPKEIAARKAAVTVGPVFFYPRRGATGPDFLGEGGSELDEAVPALATRLHQEGVKVAFRSGEGGNVTELLGWAAQAVRWGMPHAAAIRALTRDAAEILGVADRIGAIEPGKDADLLLFGGDPLVPTTPLLGVMVGGRTEYPFPP